jgi:hypothetical protein
LRFRHRTHARTRTRTQVDANSIDIYRGADAVILMVDPCRRQTLDYCERLLPDIPAHMAVLLLVRMLSTLREKYA